MHYALFTGLLSKIEVRAAKDPDFPDVCQQDREYKQQDPWSWRYMDTLEQGGQPAELS
jgi:hypothetical protein